MQVSSNDFRLLKLLYPSLFERKNFIEANNGRFVYYTNAETAVSIIKNREVWMRKSTIMNDFLEVEHGLECLQFAYSGEAGLAIRNTLDSMFSGISNRLTELFDGWIPHFQADTYLTCISEHLPDEDLTGRLSMWRAYGGTSGVALVMNNKPFFATNELKAYTAPVAYLNKYEFEINFKSLVKILEENKDFIATLPYDDVLGAFFWVFRFAMLCTKHKGFHEEKEWRIIYSPSLERSNILIEDLRVIKGLPQLIYKIPLINFIEYGITDVEIPQLLERLIIGPTEFPRAAYEAFIVLLEQAGVTDASNRVVLSDIPLRQ